jgi:hypothetical protein
MDKIDDFQVYKIFSKLGFAKREYFELKSLEVSNGK